MDVCQMRGEALTFLCQLFESPTRRACKLGARIRFKKSMTGTGGTQMNRLGRVLLLTASLVVTTAVVGHFHPGKIGAAGIDQVQVVNSTASPLPVTGSVTAAHSGPWTVGINRTPPRNWATPSPCN